MKYGFKRFEEREFDYLYQTKKECFKWYVEKVFGEWNEEIQIEFFRDEITRRPDAVKVITYKGKSIGLFTNYVDDENNSFIELFYIDKKYRGRGIGTEILKEQLEKDRINSRDTILRVFKDNPARFLYQKVGFEIYKETETHYEMIRRIKKEGRENG